jgi:DNA (cytosine-5)-methyltransferase 1
VSYAILNAADYGVPQNRQRLFIVGGFGKELELPPATHWGKHERRLPPANVSDLLAHKTASEALKGLRSRPEAGEEVNGLYGHLLPEIPPGGNYLHYTAKAGHPNALFEWRSRYWTFLLKLDPNRPAPTLQGQPGPYVGPFHWENRRLRKRELLRLQGFPDEYKLVGDRRAINLQIGNSVPPALGQAVAAAIRKQMP